MDALNPESGLKPEAKRAPASPAPQSASPSPAPDNLEGRARRNLFLLACCQAVGQSCNTMMFAATGLSVITFYRHPEYANLPVTMQHIGVMIWVFPAALLMQRLGRSIGFRIGSLIGMIGAIVMSVGLYSANFLVMCVGGLILGYSVACLQMYRFAAAELVPLSYRAKAISWVTAGGVAAAVIGPSLTRITHDLVMPLYLATYASILILHVIVFTVMSFIEFPSTKALVEQSQDAAAAEPPRPLVGDREPAALHRVGHGRHAGVRHHELHHERFAARHRRLRLSACGSALGDLRARARHVRAVVLHRQSDQPLRHHHRSWPAASR